MRDVITTLALVFVLSVIALAVVAAVLIVGHYVAGWLGPLALPVGLIGLGLVFSTALLWVWREKNAGRLS